MLAAIALLLAQSPAAQHRLTWEPQADGSVTTFRRVGDLAVAARCRTGPVVRCIFAREVVPGHISVRRFEGKRLPIHTIGFMGEPAGYGCDWIGSTKTMIERFMDSTGRDLSRNIIFDLKSRWSPTKIRHIGGNYFPCLDILANINRNGMNGYIRW